MTYPVHSPARDDDAGKTPLAKAIEKRGRKIKVVDVSHLGLTLPGDKPLAKIAFRVNVKGDLDSVIVDAARYAETLARGTDAAKDEDLTRDAKTCFALWVACREVDEKGEPGISGAFPGPKWMRDNLDNDELAALLNIYNDVQWRTSPWPYRFDDDDVERLAMLCADGADTEIPTAMLAPIEREILAQYLIVVSCKLRKARSELLAAQAQIEMLTSSDERAEEPPQ